MTSPPRFLVLAGEHINDHGSIKTVFDGLAGFLTALENGQPESELLGELVDVYSQLIEHRPDLLHWRYRVVGRTSGEAYGDLDLRLTDPLDERGIEDPGGEMIGIWIKIALNGRKNTHPSEIDVLGELTGRDQWHCSKCPASFAKHEDSIEHESTVHGIAAPTWGNR